MTDKIEVTQADKSLIEKLRFRAQAASEASKMLAEAKSLRQADNPEGRDDLYEWARPEQMTEWIAADRIEELLRTAAQPEREAVLEEALRPFAREARRISDAPDLMNKSWAGTGLSYGDWHRAAAALTTPAPTSEREAVLEEAALKAATQRHKRVSGIADCETLLDAYWNGCLDAAEAIRALKTTPAPAVSRDEIVAVLQGIVDDPFIEKLGSWGLRARAILTRLGEGK